MLTTNTDKLEANSTTAKVGVVKIGQDLHAAQVTVVVQLDGSVPRRAQVIRIEQYLGWVRALRAQPKGVRPQLATANRVRLVAERFSA